MKNTEPSKVYQRLANQGFPWSCDCGEAWETREAAMGCRKCVRYLDHRSTDAYYTAPKPVGCEDCDGEGCELCCEID